jgi:hypothetical protein
MQANDRQIVLENDRGWWIARLPIMHGANSDFRGHNIADVVTRAQQALEDELRKQGEVIEQPHVFRHLNRVPEGPREGVAGSGIGGTMGDNPFAAGVR